MRDPPVLTSRAPFTDPMPAKVKGNVVLGFDDIATNPRVDPLAFETTAPPYRWYGGLPITLCRISPG
jgi:hypothetical protein